jgi:hypothetical protein
VAPEGRSLPGTGNAIGALVAVFAAPTLSAQQKPAPPSRFVQPEPIDFDDHDGWTRIFDGKTLHGWD